MKTLLLASFTASVALLPILASADAIQDAGAKSIVQFHTVVPGQIYRGGHPGDSGLAALAQAGVKTVVDLQGGDLQSTEGESEADRAEEKKFAEAHGMTFFSIPLSSLKVDFDDQSTKINEALNLISDPSLGPVFFHCHHGEDRTGIVSALYRVTYQDCSLDQAHAEMMKNGHSAFLFWIDYFLYDSGKNFLPLPGRSSKCPL